MRGCQHSRIRLWYLMIFRGIGCVTDSVGTDHYVGTNSQARSGHATPIEKR